MGDVVWSTILDGTWCGLAALVIVVFTLAWVYDRIGK